MLTQANSVASGDHHTLLLVIGERAARTYDAAIALALSGNGIQAAMLDRPLLEDALDVAWITANPEIATSRADEHDQAIRLADRDIEWRLKRVGTELTNDERGELSAALKRYDGFRASWTLSTEKHRIGLLTASMPPQAATYIDYTYQAIKRRTNVFLHGSPAGWRQLVDATPTGMRIRAGDPDHWWLEAFRHAVLGYHLVARSLAASFDLDGTEEHDVFNRASCVLRDIAPSEITDLSSDAPCPCGSERTVAQCHSLPRD